MIIKEVFTGSERVGMLPNGWVTMAMAVNMEVHDKAIYHGNLMANLNIFHLYIYIYIYISYIFPLTPCVPACVTGKKSI